MKKLITSVLLVCSLIVAPVVLTGCANTKKLITPAIVRQGAAASVSYSADKWPDAVPGIRIGQDVICSAANGTDISPTKIMANVQLLAAQLSPEAKMGINGAMLLYTGVWNSYGEDAVNKVPELKLYLQATCDGITDGLPGAAAFVFTDSPKSAVTKWPMVR